MWIIPNQIWQCLRTTEYSVIKFFGDQQISHDARYEVLDFNSQDIMRFKTLEETREWLIARYPHIRFEVESRKPVINIDHQE